MTTSPTAERALVFWGRCRSGHRWFWAASQIDGERRYDWADTEVSALDRARKAADELTSGEPADVYCRHSLATDLLKEVNTAKRKLTSGSGTGAGVVRYLYGVFHRGCDDNSDQPQKIVAFRIAKTTAKRIYYVRREAVGESAPLLGYVDRQQLESDGEVYNRSAGWWSPEFHLYAEEPSLSSGIRPPEPAASLKEAKAAMAAAHPDAGGTDAEFIKARARYEALKQQTR
ncbi:hypothetical protein [Streptacidiphilus sp. EB103A]|uniref:hypothetical protein n=1 Tax=Streptacidiphilus sp. EB103A TaxID=3156275 RepID=UPI0035178757